MCHFSPFAPLSPLLSPLLSRPYLSPSLRCRIIPLYLSFPSISSLIMLCALCHALLLCLFLLLPFCLRFRLIFSRAGACLRSVSERRKAVEQRWRGRLQLCCGAMKRGPRPGSLEQYKSTNHPGQLTPSASHTHTHTHYGARSHAHKDLKIACVGWKERSSAQTRLTGLAQPENKVCVLSMGSYAWALKLLCHKHAQAVCPCMNTVQRHACMGKLWRNFSTHKYTGKLLMHARVRRHRIKHTCCCWTTNHIMNCVHVETSHTHT